MKHIKALIEVAIALVDTASNMKNATEIRKCLVKARQLCDTTEL